ncbi:MAG: hypothetical protein HY066_01980 [Betaproteobacteria bacterium]|nr:hypothetical protein [Betaproteobacteria bacterium]
MAGMTYNDRQRVKRLPIDADKLLIIAKGRTITADEPRFFRQCWMIGGDKVHNGQMNVKYRLGKIALQHYR